VGPGGRLDLDAHRNLGELLGTAFALFGRKAGLFLGVTLLVVAPVTLLVDGVWARRLADGPDADVPLGASIASVALTAIVVPTLVTALHAVIVQRLGRGEEPTIAEALDAAADRVLPAVGAVVLYALGVLAGFVALIVPGIYLGVRWYFSAQAAVIDGLDPRAALGRSGELVEGSWWRVAGLLLVAGLVFGLLGGGLQALVAVTGSGVLYVLLLIAEQTLVLSLTALFGTLLFFDLRARRSAPVAAVAS
jgi:hypothetical protein